MTRPKDMAKLIVPKLFDLPARSLTGRSIVPESEHIFGT